MGGAHGPCGLHALQYVEVVREQGNVSAYHLRVYLIVMVLWNTQWSVITSVAQMRSMYTPCAHHVAGVMHTKVTKLSLIGIVLVLSCIVDTFVLQLMVDGACGLVGHHVLLHAVVDRPDNVCA